MILLPRCRKFQDSKTTLFDQYEKFIDDVELNGASNKSIEWHKLARQLAMDLGSEAMYLGMCREYETSRDIYSLEQSAAIVSLMAFGRSSSDFLNYQKKVHYYKKFFHYESSVIEFDNYVQSSNPWLEPKPLGKSGTVL
jgi:hypothetical protein